MRASVRSRTARHDGGVFAKILDYSHHNSFNADVHVHIRATNFKSNWANPGDIKCSRNICHMDDTSTICLRIEFPHGKVSTGTEQDHGIGRDSGCSLATAHHFELVIDPEAGIGPGGCGCGSKCILVVH